MVQSKKLPVESSPSPKNAIPSGVPVLSEKTKLPTYTWQQIAKHDNEDSAWIYCGRNVYDVTDWIEKHPGGRDTILLAAGRDCTDLFLSYHPFSKTAQKTLDQYLIGHLEGTPELTQFQPDSGFYKELCSEVGSYFESSKLDPKDPMPGMYRLAFIFFVAYVTFMTAHTLSISWPVRIIAALIFGVFQALPLLHVMHDCSHTSLSHQPWMWKFIGRLTMDYFAGASLNSWLHQHTIGHHVYTNVVGADPDLPYKKSGDLRRVSSFQDWLSFYKLQHIYLPFLYGFLAFKFRIQDITDTLLSKTNGAMRVNPMGYNPYVQQVLAKTFWAAWRLVLPLVFWKIPIGEFLLLFVAAEMATGWWLTFNFQVSHVSPQLAFPMLPESGGPSEEEWAKLQVKTTVDYAHGNWLTTFLCGALNYQTVHHLFPCVSQYHYPALSPIVARVAKKHKIKYNQLSGGFWKAFGLHYRHLVEMGLQPERPH